MAKSVDPLKPRPTFRKSPPALVERFRQVLARHPEAQVRTMFGCPCAFVGGNMVTGLYGDEWFIRLGAEQRATFLKLKGTHPFEPLPGRAMKEHVVLPPSVLASPEKLRTYVNRAVSYGRSLPPKTPKTGRSSS
ncbi:MAG: TfoX/Sxy family protein [Anaerolineales bacterium]|nr:TfoX/Sxy family protein [Anaerolineales bacterium]